MQENETVKFKAIDEEGRIVRHYSYLNRQKQRKII